MWQEITDKEQAWELMLAGLLCYGGSHVKYDPVGWARIGKDRWIACWGQGDWLSSYVYMEE